MQKIPIAFSKHLKGCNQEHVILRRAGKKWWVKVNGWLLGEDWGNFVEDHDLQLGDLLIFKYEGEMEFKVSSLVQINLRENMNRLRKELMKEERKSIILARNSQRKVWNLISISAVLYFYFNSTLENVKLLKVVHNLRGLNRLGAWTSFHWLHLLWLSIFFKMYVAFIREKSAHLFMSLHIWIMFTLLTLSDYLQSSIYIPKRVKLYVSSWMSLTASWQSVFTFNFVYRPFCC